MKYVRRFKTHSDDETIALGRQIALLLPKQGVVLLIGDLGAGKTTLTKGIVEGLGASTADYVSSPTFTLIHEYGDPVRVYHVDLYRLETAEQARRLGLEDLLDQPALVLVEWGDRFPELFPLEAITIRIDHAADESRFVELSSNSA